MERTRIVVVVAALLGIVCTFLPWVSAAGGQITLAGSKGIDGGMNIALFAVPFLIAALGNRKTKLSAPLTLVACAFGLLGAGFGFLHIVDVPNRLEPEIGVYLIVFAGLIVATHPMVGGFGKTPAAPPSTS